MPTPESCTTISACEFDALERDSHAAARRGELHGVGQQVPQHLLKARRIDLRPADIRRQRFLHSHAFRVGRGTNRFHCVADGVAQIDRLHVEANLAGHDAAHVEQVVHDLGLRAHVALDGVERAGELAVVAGLTAGDVHPADDRIQRRAQLVRTGWRGTRLSSGWPVRLPGGRRVRVRAGRRVPVERASTPCDLSARR